jgi:hypothetical protein
MKISLSLKAPRGNDDLRAASLALADALRATGHKPFIAWQEIERQGFLHASSFRSCVSICALAIYCWYFIIPSCTAG